MKTVSGMSRPSKNIEARTFIGKPALVNSQLVEIVDDDRLSVLFDDILDIALKKDGVCVSGVETFEIEMSGRLEILLEARDKFNSGLSAVDDWVRRHLEDDVVREKFTKRRPLH